MNILGVDIAPTDRSHCAGCHSSISSGEIRMKASGYMNHVNIYCRECSIKYLLHYIAELKRYERQLELKDTTAE